MKRFAIACQRLNATCARWLLGLMAWVLWSAAGPAHGRTLAEIQQSGVLRVCVAGSSAPFYQSNGEALAKAMNLKPEVTVLKEWDLQFQNSAGAVVKEASYVAELLANGSCDVFPNDLHVLDWRSTKMDLVPLYTSRKVIIAHRDRNTLKTLDDLKGLGAAVQKQTSYDTWLQEQNKTRFADTPITITYMPTAQAIAAVANKSADFTVIAAESAFKWVRGDLDNLDLLFSVDTPVSVAWGIHPKATGLRARLEQFFQDSARVGSDLDRAWSKQYGISLMEYQLYAAAQSSDSGALRRWLVWLLPLGAGLLALVLAFVVWNRRLQREIAERKAAEVRSQAIAEQVTRRDALNTQVGVILMSLQRVTNCDELAQTLFTGMAPLLALGQASLYQTDATAKSLVLGGAYARTGALSPDANIPFGSGLLGQCAAERRPQILENPPAGYLTIQSGLGSAQPQAIALLPILNSGELLGVMELALMRPWGEDDQELMDRLLPMVAMSMEIIARNENAHTLLTATQEQAHALETQQGEIALLLQEQANARAQLSLALESANMGTWKYFVQEGRLEADGNTQRLYGLEGVALDGSMAQWFTFIHPDDLAPLGQTMQDTMARQQVDYRATFRVQMGQGNAQQAEVRHIMSTGKFSYDAQGKATVASGVVWDITDIKRAEEEVSRNRQFMEAVLENINSAVYVKDRHGVYTFVNGDWERATGLRRADVLGHSTLELNHQGRGQEYHEADMLVLREGRVQTVEETVQNDDKTFRTYQTVKVPMRQGDDITGLCNIAFEITERKQLERAVASERERLQSILDKSPICISITALNGTVLFANPVAKQLFGLEIGQAAQSVYVHPEQRTELLKSIKAQGLVTDFEVDIYDSVQQVRTMSLTAMVTEFDAQPGLLVWQIDVTERKRVEENIKHINFLNDQALDLTRAGHWHIPLNTGDEFYNSSERAATIFGDPPRPDWRYHLMNHWFAHVEAGDKEAAAKTFENFNAALAGTVPRYDAIYAYQRPVDGRVIWVHAMGHVVRDADGKPADMYGVTVDVTATKLAETELQERMDELERFQTLTIDREERMIALKVEINALLQAAGLPAKYKIVE